MANFIRKKIIGGKEILLNVDYIFSVTGPWDSYLEPEDELYNNTSVINTPYGKYCVEGTFEDLAKEISKYSTNNKRISVPRSGVEIAPL